MKGLGETEDELLRVLLSVEEGDIDRVGSLLKDSDDDVVGVPFVHDSVGLSEAVGVGEKVPLFDCVGVEVELPSEVCDKLASAVVDHVALLDSLTDRVDVSSIVMDADSVADNPMVIDRLSEVVCVESRVWEDENVSDRDAVFEREASTDNVSLWVRDRLDLFDKEGVIVAVKSIVELSEELEYSVFVFEADSSLVVEEDSVPESKCDALRLSSLVGLIDSETDSDGEAD